MAHQHKYAIQCHSCRHTLENTDRKQIKNRHYKTEHNPEKNNTKHRKTKIAWFSHFLRHSVRKRCRLILQHSLATRGNVSKYHRLGLLNNIQQMTSLPAAISINGFGVKSLTPNPTQFSHFSQHPARERGGLILQHYAGHRHYYICLTLCNSNTINHKPHNCTMRTLKPSSSLT